jgi:hypothetical protein
MTYLNPETVPIPGQDSVDNNYLQDVVGNKTDTHSGDSLYSLSETLNDHVHKPSKVYPTLAAGVTITCGTPAWTLGNFVEIVPASTITTDFDIHHLSIENLSANAVYEIVLYYGGSDIEAGRVRVTKNTNFDSVFNVPMQTPIIPANSRIRAKIASDSGNADTSDLSIKYHEY